METIELAVARLRRPLRTDDSACVAPAAQVPARPSPAPHAFKAQLAETQLPIKTRVLCEYSPAVQAIVSGNTARPPQTLRLPFAIIASVIAGMVGATGMAAAMWYSTHSANQPQSAARDSGAMSRSAPAAAAASDTAQARALVDAWAKAWSARDVESYLDFYAAGFVSEKGLPRAAWEAGRRKRLGAQRVINVAVRDVKVEAHTADHMTVRFVQHYSADTYREPATPKKLLLVREAGVWRIAAEAAG